MCNLLLYLFRRQFIAVEEPSVLDGIVHALGKCVVQRISRLRHADTYALLLEPAHIARGAVQYAPVGMMYQLLRRDTVRAVEGQGHLQSLQGAIGIKRGMHGIPYDQARGRVGDEREVGPAGICRHIGDVAHHEFAASLRNKPGLGVEQVGIDVEGMTRIRRAGTSAVAHHQSVETEHIEALVTADGHLPAEALHAKRVQLAHSRTGKLVLTDPAAIQDDAGTEHVKLRLDVLMTVITLSADAKKITEEGDGVATFPLRQGPDYLASDFFRMGIL